MTHVPSGLMGCASAALGWWVGGRRQNQTCLNFFAPRCRWKSQVLWNLFGHIYVATHRGFTKTTPLSTWGPSINDVRTEGGRGIPIICPKANEDLLEKQQFWDEGDSTLWDIIYGWPPTLLAIWRLHCACILSLLGAWAVDDLCRNWNKGASATAAAPILIQIRGILKKSRMSHRSPLCPPSDEAANSTTEDCT